MFEVASQIIICLILAALLGWIIGYLIGKATCNEKNEDKYQDIVVPLMSKPELLTSAREGGKDNLQLIKGVGKVLEALLNETGIYHFEQISNLTAEEVSWLDNSMAFPGRIEREAWVAQAKDLAEGKATEFSQRVERGKTSSSKKS